MLYRVYSIIIALLFLNNLNATEKDSILFSFNDKKVSLSEFNKVYKKSNIGNADAYSLESLNEYLSLYINFKLKVQEALDTKFDTVPSVRSEINKYRSQLSKSHMQNNNAYDGLMVEAYERKKTIRDASHILIKVGESANSEDTLKAFTKITEVYKRLKSGEEISKLAVEVSEDPSAKKNNGYLGFVQVLNYVYQFESAVYSTPINEISTPFRTRFGYHVIKVHSEEKNPGSVQTAHLFLKSGASNPDKRDNIERIYKEVISGKISFEDAVKLYSEDTQSKPNDGKLRWFGKGEMVTEYQDASFALKNIGDISKPVQTRYGWHIIKLLDKKQLSDYETEKSSIKQKILKSARRQVAQKRLISQIKKSNNYVFYNKNFAALEKKVLSMGSLDFCLAWDNCNSKTSKTPTLKGKWEKPLFSMNDKIFTQKELLIFMKKQRRYKKGTPIKSLLKNYFTAFEEQSCLSYEESMLEVKDPEFKALMKEYHDGILLFEIMDKKVWSKAVSDSAGLENFYQNNKRNYLWEERLHSKRYICNEPRLAKEVFNLIEKHPETSDTSIFKQFNNEKKNQKVFIEEHKVEKADDPFEAQTKWKTGIHLIEKPEDKTFYVINNLSVIPKSPKELDDTKGQVIADYQDYIEKEWIGSLQNKYEVKTNLRLLEQLKK